MQTLAEAHLEQPPPSFALGVVPKRGDNLHRNFGGFRGEGLRDVHLAINAQNMKYISNRQLSDNKPGKKLLQS